MGSFTCLDRITANDPAVAEAIRREERRQLSTLEMIASENFASPAVMEAQGCVMTNKYAEGYPGKRYYGGCDFVDEVERLAIERGRELFGAEHLNVQPHSGAQANMAVYFSHLEPGDSVVGLKLDHGGHLTHGHQANFSGKLYKISFYGVNKQTERIDPDELRAVVRAAKPKMLVTGASAYPRIIDFNLFREIADEVGALLMVDMAHFAGLVAGGHYPSPVPVADFVTSTTHKTLRGPRAGIILCKEKHAKGVDSRVFPGVQGGPLMHVVAAKAIAFGEALKPSFKRYAKQTIDNCRVLGESLVEQGLRLVSGGTDTHLVLVDLQPFKLTGDVAEKALEHAGITVNKNMIPFDPSTARKPSGIRIGTPALTTRGMREAEMKTIGLWIAQALKAVDNPVALDGIRKQVEEMTSHFPLHAASASDAHDDMASTLKARDIAPIS